MNRAEKFVKHLQPAKDGPTGFGSFQSVSVEHLISLPHNDYQPPNIPFDVTAPNNVAKLKLGSAELKERLFLLDPNWCFLNHGAFGSAFLPAIKAGQKWVEVIESQPLKFLDRELLPLLVYVTRELAKFVNSDPKNLVLTPNATTGTSAVLRSIDFKKDDIIVHLGATYGPTKKLVHYICSKSGATSHEIQIQFPIHREDDVISTLSSALDSLTAAPRLVILDHITSGQAVTLPVEKLIGVIKSKNKDTLVLIDGAHVLGNLDLDLTRMETIGCDFYVSNAHKWLCCPKGCAFLYASKRHQQSLHALSISHGYRSGFLSEFVWTGLRDNSPYLSLLTVLDVWKTLGVTNIRSYCHNLALWAGDMLAKTWSTDLIAPRTMFSSFITVRLPGPQTLQFEGEHQYLQDLLHFKYNIEVPIKKVGDSLYVRASAHIYNNKKDYERLARVMLDIRGNK